MIATTPALGQSNDPSIKIDATEADEAVGCRIARTRAEREAAFRLLQQSYVRAGLSEPSQRDMRVSPYHLEPTTQIFVAIKDPRGPHPEVVATLTLVMDGEYGLPMESIYAEQINRRRDMGLKLAEVTCLADRRHQIARFLPLFCELTRLMGRFARHQQVDQVVIAVHPKHARFYKRFMYFEEMGGLKMYPMVKSQPAEALFMDFAEIDKKQHLQPKRYEFFFGGSVPDEILMPASMTAAEIDDFSRLVDPSFQVGPVLSGATQSAVAV